MKINGKDYKIPEINIETIKELEKYGVYFMYGETGKSVLTIITAFICIAAHITPSEANEAVEKHILAGGGIGEWMEDITAALETSKFVNQIKSKPKANKPVFRFMIDNGSELK